MFVKKLIKNVTKWRCTNTCNYLHT